MGCCGVVGVDIDILYVEADLRASCRNNAQTVHLEHQLQRAKDSLEISIEDLSILRQQNEAHTSTLSALLVQVEAADRHLRNSEAANEEAHNKLASLVKRRQEIEEGAE